MNEPHYLAKARHFADPAWCQRDLFLQSVNAHAVFFASCVPFLVLTGSSFYWLAFTTRLASFAVLAVALTNLGSRLVGARLTFIGLLLWLALGQLGSLSGEWLALGAESKVPAWGFVLLSLSSLLDTNYRRVGIWLGMAVAFHPVIGAWATLAVITHIVIARVPPSEVRRGILPLLLLGIPGFVSALPALMTTTVPEALVGHVSSESEMQTNATYVQVFGRLDHHLDPLQFGWPAWVRYAIYLATWLALSRGTSTAGTLRWVVLAGAAFAILGLICGSGPRPAELMHGYVWRMNFLKLYPFRFVDGLLPVLLGFELVSWIKRKRARGQGDTDQPTEQSTIRLVLTCGGLSIIVLAGPAWRAINKATPPARSDWHSVCAWIRSSTPVDALFITPRYGRDFKWCAERAEYATYKDCPQNASAILLWNRRFRILAAWKRDFLADGECSSADLQQLGDLTGAEYLVTSGLNKSPARPVCERGVFRVYELREPGIGPRSSTRQTN